MPQGVKRLIVGTAALWITAAVLFMPMRVLIAFQAAILSLLALAGLTITANNRRYHRLANQRCVNCGYDLRASKETCPECGAAFGFGWGGMMEE